MIRTLFVVATITAATLTSAATAAASPGSDGAAQSGQDVYYKNCSAARDAGAAPILQGQAGYRSALDRDGDGIACE